MFTRVFGKFINVYFECNKASLAICCCAHIVESDCDSLGSGPILELDWY